MVLALLLLAPTALALLTLGLGQDSPANYVELWFLALGDGTVLSYVKLFAFDSFIKDAALTTHCTADCLASSGLLLRLDAIYPRTIL